MSVEEHIIQNTFCLNLLPRDIKYLSHDPSSVILNEVSVCVFDNDVDGGFALRRDIPVRPHRKALGCKHLDKVRSDSC